MQSRNFLIALVAILVLALGLPLWGEIRYPYAVINQGTDQSSDAQMVYVNLDMSQFDSMSATLAGKVEIMVTPTLPPDSTATILPPTEESFPYIAVDLLCMRSMESGSRVAEVAGSVDAPIEMHRMFGGLRGSSEIDLVLEPLLQAFYYPFDRYELSCNFYLDDASSENEEWTTPVNVDQFTMLVRSSDLRGINVQRAPVPLGDVYVVFQRPIPLQIVTGLIGGASLIWLIYLWSQKDVSSQMGQLVAFVVGVWGFRGVIQPGDAIFPALSDYLTLGLTAAAVLIVLTRWWQAPAPEATRTCPHCRETIPAAATRCGHCTAAVDPAAPPTPADSPGRKEKGRPSRDAPS